MKADCYCVGCKTTLYGLNATNKATGACCAAPIGLVIKPPLLEPNAAKHQVAFPIGCGRMPLRCHRSRKLSRISSLLFVFLQFVSGIWSAPIRFPIETLVAFDLRHSSFCFLPMGGASGIASNIACESALLIGFPIEMGMPLTTPLQIAAVFLLAW